MQYEAKLSDGRTVVMESDHEPTNDEVLAAVGSYEKGLESNSAKALLRGVGIGAAPTTAFSVAAGAVAPIATEAAAAFPATLPFSPLIGAGAGILAGTGAAALTEFGQDKLAKAVLPESTYWRLKNQLEADQRYHEYAQMAGEVLSGAPSMKFATVGGKLLRELPKRAAVGAAVGTALPLVQGRLPQWRDPLMGAAFGTVYEGPRDWAHFGKPAGPFVPGKTIAQEHETPAPEEAAAAPETAEAKKGLQPTTPRVADQATQDLIDQINKLAEDPETQGFTINDEGNRVPTIPNMDKVRQLNRLQAQLEELLAGKKKSAVDKAVKATGENRHAVQTLTQEDLNVINEERKAIDTPIEIADAPTDDPNNPFNRSRAAGNFMTIDRKTGKIVIFPEQFTQWFNKDLRHLSPEQKRAALKARLLHEKIHLGVNDQDALDYWGKMTGFEKWAEERIYLRGGQRDPDLSDTMMGHEALRRRLEMASQMGPAEFLEAATGERWTLKTVGAMSDLVRSLREMSTMKGREQQAIFDRIQKNLDVVAQALRTQEFPGSRRRFEGRPEETEEPKRPEGTLISELKESTRALEQITSQSPDFMDVSKFGRDDHQRLQMELSNLVGATLDKQFDRAMNARSVIVNLLRDYGADPLPAYQWADAVMRSVIRYSKAVKAVRDMREAGEGQPEVGPGLGPGSRRKSEFEREKPKQYPLSREEFYRVREAPVFINGVEPKNGNEYEAAKLIQLYGYDDAVLEIRKAINKQLERVNPNQDILKHFKTLMMWVEDLAYENISEVGLKEPTIPDYFQQVLNLPGSRRKYQPGQKEMFPILTARGVPGEEPIPEQRAGPEGVIPRRMTAAELAPVARQFIEQPVEAKKIDVARMKEGGEPVRPTYTYPRFADFVDMVKSNMGNVRPDQLVSMWEDLVWKHLQDASPERLADLRKALNLEKKFGTREIPSKLGKEFELLPESEAGKRETLKTYREIRKRREAEQRYRTRIQTEIAVKMLGESLPDQTKLDRPAITIDDIDFDNPNAVEDPWTAISKDQSKSKAVLTSLIRDQARRSGKDPVSWTKNVLALLNTQTGEVELVSSYPHGRSGAMFTEPGVKSIKARPNRPIEDMPFYYQPIYRILLKEPVQNFNQHFKNIEEFNKALGTEGNRMALEAQYAEFAGEPSPYGRRIPFTGNEMSGHEAPEGLRPQDIFDEEGVEGTPGLRGPGGGITGPMADVARGVQVGAGKGVLIPKGEMTATEAGAVMDTVIGDVGKVESVADMQESLNEIAWRNEHGKMTGRDWSVISALQKATRIVRHEHRDWTPEAVADHVLNTFYENITKNEGYEDYIQKTLGRFALPTRFAGGRRPGQPAITTTPPGIPERGISREIVAPSRVAPTVARPEQSPAGIYPNVTTTPPEPFRAQEPPIREQMLSPEAQAILERERKPLPERFESPVFAKPAGGEAFYAKGKTGLERYLESKGIKPKPTELPGSPRKMADVIDRELSRLRMSGAAWVKRRGVKFEMSAAADRSDRDAIVLSEQVRNFIRLNVKDQRNLSAANALIQAGAWEPKYKMSEEAKAMFDQMVSEDPRNEMADNMLKSKDEKNQSTGRAMKNSIEGLAIRTLLRIGALDHAQAEYVFREDAFQILPQFQHMLRTGEIMARRKMASSNPRVRLEGHEQMRAIETLKPELDHAVKNWKNDELRNVALKMRMELDQQYDREVQSGHSLRYDPDYLPGRFDGDIFDDYQVRFFSGGKIFGREFHSPKTFTSYYEAASKGPFVPVTRDGAALVGHRIRQGMRQSNKRAIFVPAIKELVDPVTGEKVGAEPKKVDDRWQAPSPAHELFYLNGPRHRPVAVRADFADVIHELFDPSAMKKWPVTRELLEFGQRLKHTLLFLDVFHLMRLGYYGASIMGKDIGYKGGLSLLEYRPQDLKAAMEAGEVSKESYKWATEPIKIGRDTVTRQELAGIIMRQTGLNVGRIMDALYMDLVKNVPFIRGFNRFVFEKLQRGLMVQTAVQELERMSRKFPDADVNKLAKDIARDTNTYFGSLGRQGVFRSATFQDLSRLPFLAPQWVEGLVRKEMGFAGRLAGPLARAAGVPYRQGLPAMGTLGFGMARGLVAMLAITQLMNLITRRKPTWENEEKGHKFDAWIPSAETPGQGFWMSPLAIFQELSHDLVRLNETKPKFWDALNQIGQNKLSPYGRAAYIAATGTKMGGQRMTTSPAVMAEIGRQFTPLPITFSSIGGRIGHAVAPGVFPAQRPGQIQRQMIASAGIKVEPSLTASQQVGQLAKDFVEQNGLKKEIGYDLVMTDEPGYYKLRAALKSGDEREARKNLEKLMESRTLQQVFTAMREWSRRPATGSHTYEKYFLSTLSESQLELYTKMQEEKVELLDKFVNLVAGTK